MSDQQARDTAHMSQTAKKNREFFFQLVYIIQVKSVDKAVSGRVLNYSSNLFIWKINKKLSAM